MNLPEPVLAFLQSQGLIWLPLLAGYRLRRAGLLSEALARPLHTVNFTLLSPLVFGLGVWKLDRTNPDWVLSPLIFLIFLVVSTLGTLGVVRWVRDHPRRKGTTMLMLPISNIGHTMAGFLTLMLLPIEAYPYSACLIVPQLCFVFTVWLPLARHFRADGGRDFWATYRRALFSPITLPLIGGLIGLGINLGGPSYPLGLDPLLKVLVFGGTAVTMFAMGSRMHFSRIGPRQPLLLLTYAFKFLLYPGLVVALCLVFGLRGLPAAAMFIVGCMPSGVTVVGFSTIYDMDVDLANAGYLWSTLIFMLLVLPLMILGLQMPMFQPVGG